MTAFRHLIRHIFSMRTFKKMVYADAARIVAAMQKMLFWVRPERQKPSRAVRQLGFAVFITHNAITIRIARFYPLNAAVIFYDDRRIEFSA